MYWRRQEGRRLSRRCLRCNGRSRASATWQLPWPARGAKNGSTKTVSFVLSYKEFRRLLDLVYMGNWVLNSTRGEDRFQDYDDLESKLFGLCRRNGMGVLVEDWEGVPVPSQAYAEGGIHEAISYYEDNMFYEILAEELSRRDMDYADITDENYDEIVQRMDTYMDEFEVSGVDHLVLEEE